MTVNVHVSAMLRNRCGAQGNFSAEAKSIRELVEAIDREHPGFTGIVLRPDGSIQKEVLVSINGELIHPHTAVDTALQAGDKVYFLSAFAGG